MRYTSPPSWLDTEDTIHNTPITSGEFATESLKMRLLPLPWLSIRIQQLENAERILMKFDTMQLQTHLTPRVESPVRLAPNTTPTQRSLAQENSDVNDTIRKDHVLTEKAASHNYLQQNIHELKI
jgi:hypothetical protein